MPNNENDLSDNSGNPHIGSNFDDFLEEEGIREEVEDAAMTNILGQQKRRITIMVAGPKHIGKQHLILFLEKFIREELKAQDVVIPHHVQTLKEMKIEAGTYTEEDKRACADAVLSKNNYEILDGEEHA